jgi:cytochrome subunit of sulfide dehydrogenase
MNQPPRCKPVRARGPLHAAACAMMLACVMATMAATPARAQTPASGTAARDPSPPASTAAPAGSASPPANTAASAVGPSSPAITAAPAGNPPPAIVPPPAKTPSLPAISAGARLAANCAACHGTNGVTDGIALPSLAGQGKGALLVALKAFKSGARQGTIMPQIARGYTDEQLAQLAEFFAAQPPVPVAALPPSPGQPAVAAPVSRLAVTGWPQEHATFAGYGHAAPILRAAGGQP